MSTMQTPTTNVKPTLQPRPRPPLMLDAFLRTIAPAGTTVAPRALRKLLMFTLRTLLIVMLVTFTTLIRLMFCKYRGEVRYHG